MPRASESAGALSVAGDLDRQAAAVAAGAHTLIRLVGLAPLLHQTGESELELRHVVREPQPRGIRRLRCRLQGGDDPRLLI